MKYTREQQAAIDALDRNVIVTAGAGSGKTRVLVGRFMKLLDEHPNWPLGAVVAITFTEKAATEMLDRVRQAIEDRVQAALAAGDGMALDRWLAHQAALSWARIGTIHALCAALLRENPAEAALDPDFDVLDEVEAAILRDDAIDLALAQLAEEDRPGSWVLAAYEVRQVRRTLAAYAGASEAAHIAGWLAGDETAIVERWQSYWVELMALLMAEAQDDPALREAVGWVPPSGWPDDDTLMPNWRLIQAHEAALFGDDPLAFCEAVEALAGGINRRGGKADNWGGKDGVTECRQVLKVVQDWAKHWQKHLLPYPGELDAEAGRWLLAWGDAIRCAADHYQQLKAARRALDFDDLEERARQLLRDHPDVVARYVDPVDGEFRHILVDEFQDTNESQREIIYRLSGADEGAAGRLFVVGDPKQSIYGFRGADVTVFDRVRVDFTAPVAGHDSTGIERSLSRSFRAHERLVAAFNAVFSRILSGGHGLSAPYETPLDQPLEAHRPAEKWHDVPLEIIGLPKLDRNAYPEMDASAYRRWEAAEIADRLHALVREGRPVWDGEQRAYRPVEYGDIAILFQSMTQVTDYEQVFKVMGLPYVTLAGRGYFDRQEVWDLIATLRALHNPADDLSLATALRSPLFGLSDEALLALRLVVREDGTPVPLCEALAAFERASALPSADVPACTFARARFAELRDVAGRATIAELLQRTLDLTGYLATLTGLPDGARRRGNVEKLIALARASGRIGLGEFLAYAHDLSAREVREGEAAPDVEGVVRLMTVHASKGLEFPVVVLANADWTRRGGRADVFALDRRIGPVCRLPDNGDDDKPPEPFGWRALKVLDDARERAERRRLLYVAATRAADLLILSGRLDQGEHTWLAQWLAALGLTAEDVLPDPQPSVWSFGWGHGMVTVPPEPYLPEDRAPTTAGQVDAWEVPEVVRGVVIPDIQPELPPLTAEVPVDPAAPATELSASHLIQLGNAPFFDPAAVGDAIFRHAVLYDAPQPIRPLPSVRPDSDQRRRAVGDIVHQALRAWALPDVLPAEALAARLWAYAWETHLTARADVERAVEEAWALLERFAASDVRQRIESASQVYREIPFVHQNAGRTVHGVIDVLTYDGKRWHVWDFKTSPVRWESVPRHARRYYHQVGAYARAVEASTGQQPAVWLYYIHPGRLFEVRAVDWEPVYAHLGDDVRRALNAGLGGAGVTGR